jgi:sugar lactone lactonase YvrE
VKRIFRYALVSAALGLGAGTAFCSRTIDAGRSDATPAKIELLNPAGEFVGPEGIQFDARGNLYIGDTESRVWVMEGGASPKVYAQLDALADGSAPSGPIAAGGMAFDKEGRLYVACYGYAGGSIIRVEPAGRKVTLFARDAGIVNYLVITQEGRHLWASDFRSKGRVLRFTITDEGGHQPDLAAEGLSYPNSLALGRDEKALYVAETYSGEIRSIDRLNPQSPPVTVAHLRGAFAVASLDGLAFDPRDGNRRFLYVAENLRGLFSVVDLESRPPRVVKRLSLARMGGRPCPASMVIRDGHLYFTDLWSCNPLRIILGIPNYHTHAWRCPVMDLTMTLTRPRLHR